VKKPPGEIISAAQYERRLEASAAMGEITFVVDADTRSRFWKAVRDAFARGTGVVYIPGPKALVRNKKMRRQ